MLSFVGLYILTNSASVGEIVTLEKTRWLVLEKHTPINIEVKKKINLFFNLLSIS